MRFLRSRPLIITVVLVVALIVLLGSTPVGAALSEGASTVASVFAPVQRVLYEGGEALQGPSPSPSVRNQATAGDTPGSLMDYEELVAENERLRAMLDYKESNVSQELKVGRITGKEPGNWFEVFTIDIGVNDGITEGMPVVTPAGLVGKVSEASLSTAKVVTIIDPRSNVSAIMERTRDTGVVKGTISADDLSATLSMNYLPLDTDIIEGDVVLTSGYDEVYPKGLTIGTVTGSSDQAGGKHVTVEPSVDFRRLEEVMVIVRTAVTEEEATSVIVPSSHNPITGASATSAPAEATAMPEETAEPQPAATTYPTSLPEETQTASPEPTETD